LQSKYQPRSNGFDAAADRPIKKARQLQIAAQEANAAQQQKQIEALTTAVRKVSDRVELRPPTPQIAATNTDVPSRSAAPPTSGQTEYTGCKNSALLSFY